MARPSRPLLLDPPADAREAELVQLPAPAAGHPVAEDAVGPEPAEHMRLGEGGEVTQGADAQPVQQLGQFRPAEDPHREGGEEVRRPPSGTIRPPRAASTAANSPSATPTSTVVIPEVASMTSRTSGPSPPK